MIRLPRRETRALVAIHGWSGVLLGLVLYVVICTGVAAVFAKEISSWESPLPHPASLTASGFAPGLDDALRRHAAQVDPQFLEDIAVYAGAGDRVNLRYHRHDVNPQGQPDERGVEFELDPHDWHVLDRREGWSDELAAKRTGGIAAWLINLHVRLHIPEPWGLIVTGVLGLAMMIAGVSGLLIHRHLLADLFTLRVLRDAVLRRRDLHVVAGSWNLPFVIVVAFTGSFFSFASTIAVPAIAMVQFGGDSQALTEVLYDTPRPENAAPAPLANVETLLADAAGRRGGHPSYLEISHFGRADASVSIYTELPRDELVYTRFLYDGTSGHFQQELPPLGRTSSLGADLVGLMYPLHFGNFAGVASKAVWAALGTAAAYVTFSGLLLWTRRRAEQPAWRRMGSVVSFVGYTLPLGLVGAPYAFFAMQESGLGAIPRQDVAFLAIVGIAALAAAVLRDDARLRRWLVGGTAVALLGLPLLRWTQGGPGWTQAMRLDLFVVPAMDIDAAGAGRGLSVGGTASGRRHRKIVRTGDRVTDASSGCRSASVRHC